MTICKNPECKREFEQNNLGPKKVFCSYTCGISYHREKYKKEREFYKLYIKKNEDETKKEENP